MRPALPVVVEALALRAEKDGAPQSVPPRMLREIAEALKDLQYIGQHGGAWEQRVARDGRAPDQVSVQERVPASDAAPAPRREPGAKQPRDSR